MTPEQLIADYRARGGRITACPTLSAYQGKQTIRLRGPRRRWRSRPPKYARSWEVVMIEETQIAAAEAWLRERQYVFHTNITPIGGAYKVRIKDLATAVLFKLTWGGR